VCELAANAADMARVKVNYETFKGWQTCIAKVRKFGDLPKNAQDYVRAVERLVNVPGNYHIKLHAICM
jgi:adenylosuccinate synthase